MERWNQENGSAWGLGIGWRLIGAQRLFLLRGKRPEALISDWDARRMQTETMTKPTSQQLACSKFEESPRLPGAIKITKMFKKYSAGPWMFLPMRANPRLTRLELSPPKIPNFPGFCCFWSGVVRLCQISRPWVLLLLGSQVCVVWNLRIQIVKTLKIHSNSCSTSLARKLETKGGKGGSRAGRATWCPFNSQTLQITRNKHNEHKSRSMNLHGKKTKSDSFSMFQNVSKRWNKRVLRLWCQTVSLCSSLPSTWRTFKRRWQVHWRSHFGRRNLNKHFRLACWPLKNLWTANKESAPDLFLCTYSASSLSEVGQSQDHKPSSNVLWMCLDVSESRDPVRVARVDWTPAFAAASDHIFPVRPYPGVAV